MKRFSCILGLCLLVACDKDKGQTDVPTDTADEPENTSADAEPDVPQEPDPPEIAQGARLYLQGNYQDAVSMLEPVYTELKERSQYRASGLAGAWIALAHAQIVFENAEEPAQHALSMAEKTGDPEVKAAAQAAHGAFLLGNEDYTAAKQAFDAAASAAPETAAGAIANILRAEALIGRAFGSGASDDVKNPADLEAAKQAYQKAADTAHTGIEEDILMGRIEEGLAAIAKYQGEREAVCTHAVESVQHLKAGEASDFLIDGPMRLAKDHNCKMPKG